jgi:spore germination cell wall hydrolase CwlJ-like protein
VFQAQPAQSVTVSLTPSIANEAAWLYRAGWPLYALVDRYAAAAQQLDTETNCLATAVYFEARGESLEGQLAVARVVMNRAASGKYPPSWCATIKQPAQFSFVRHGEFPTVDTACDAWRKAEGIARLAAANAVPSVGTDVLWYHADYVAPSWGHRLNVVEKIGAHIFYRA